MDPSLKWDLKFLFNLMQECSSYSDEDYKKSGAKISSKLSELYKADVIVKIQRPVKNKKINEFSYLETLIF